MLFAEWAREGGSKFAQAGVRWWVQRERVALDFSLQQRRGDGERASGFIVGLALYDL